MKHLRAGLLCALSLQLALPVCVSQSVQYALTVRDFLPSSCSLVNTNVGPERSFITRTGVRSEDCPYKSDILAGKVSGHPDFDKGPGAGDVPAYFYDLYKVDGRNGFIRGQPGRRSFERTVEEFIELAPSGLPKPVYCSGNDFAGANGTVRCGYFRTPDTGTEYFSTVSAKEFDGRVFLLAYLVEQDIL